ncbi:16S rRNA (cytosine(967)-C(5))-methyltransferase [Desertifilum sp. FACHB-1129]|uniref:16S rRNA (cytosine(967)-C(5))-methyltransferase n=1 Tax=Desertifilum tharense IPPAS B-1220 TaxID=1781255 RepID=A0A1E5QFL7_9CYAN|nr:MULTISPECIES: 16S rRNA (cytosine(967)-C(5))-methyltransferase [Desertifilum]MDA0213290.1 16S rRNA (cytosine(967)-C(5))-methyltransferase [Cyanobacteria bacterium FC1]MBD2310351.1 16S rRNA (cytosine(967)-C(5))-methyltransferase [Desertifilum sp. FACHB-1129]MBD2321802.1 16S rRNA (cytosine(967)-C(5))-methyltransferase [Desertifilum sp. FACHB-866]MBD2331929.1 16S rRNA (cytosine(967)-C(5))-methyltransferase [Desertifilum sp. FACHB-868]OEJ73475.1 16S rRNA (cytosine(967)-C(5))-methyltransferase [D
MTETPRQIAFFALRDVHRRGAYADVALDRWLRQSQLEGVDRRFVTELVYGSVRRMRSLDFRIDQLAKKPADQQPPDLRTILHLGLYQLHYLDQVRAAAAVDTTVELAKTNGFRGLAGFVNGLLRSSHRRSENRPFPDPAPASAIERLGIEYSYPDWIVEGWLTELGEAETEELCAFFNQTPTIDLRVNPLRTTRAEVEAQLQAWGVEVQPLPYSPQGLRLTGSIGAIEKLPGFREGHWVVQDSSAQLVAYLLNPQPDEMIIDACAAPGGKTTHIAELMGDRGVVVACDRTPSRLKKLIYNTERLGLESVQICIADSRDFLDFDGKADRVLLDAPCSGLGTLHRHADARWRQTPESVQELTVLQGELLNATARWVKPGGTLVYSTCTLHRAENESAIAAFLDAHPDWSILPPAADSAIAPFASAEGWIKLWPHRHHMDGFFMVQLAKK